MVMVLDVQDKAGSDHLIQAAASEQPKLKLSGQNGRPVLMFGGAQHLKDAEDSTAGFSGASLTKFTWRFMSLMLTT